MELATPGSLSLSPSLYLSLSVYTQEKRYHLSVDDVVVNIGIVSQHFLHQFHKCRVSKELQIGLEKK